jgi:hypothetical protein
MDSNIDESRLVFVKSEDQFTENGSVTIQKVQIMIKMRIRKIR